MRILLGVLGLTACSFASGASGDTGAPATTGASNAVPLVVELFTSQGCSSCPPADRLVSKIVKTGELDGRPVIPLSFHVDYWNELGWADPYSLPAWTQRQREYSDALGDRSVYTPELVVGGAKGLVGSQSGAVASAIGAAAPQRAITATATWAPATVTVTATAPDDADVLVAVWETHTSTDVPRGENSGETLPSDHVVRRLEKVAAVGATGTITIKLDPKWNDVGAVAFAQRKDKRIVGASALPRK